MGVIEPKKYYLNAAICKGGHVINSELKIIGQVEETFCPDCGEEIISICEQCSAFIHGDEMIEYKESFFSEKKSIEKIPNYCYCCGKPYPWTQKKLDDYKELLTLELENEKELQEKIYSATEEFVKNGCKTTTVKAEILKKYLEKLRPISKEILVNAIGSLSTEAIKNFF